MISTTPTGAPVTGPRRARRPRGGFAPLAVFVVLLLLVLLWTSTGSLWGADLVAPEAVDVTQKFLAPSATHWFGTDYLGRDVFSRTLFGLRETLLGAAIAVILAYGIGLALGVAAGTAGGAVRSFVFRCLDVVQSIPGIVLPMVIVAALGFGTVNAALAVGIAAAPRIAYILYRTVPEVLTADYIEADYQMGASRFSTMFRHVLPNAVLPAIAIAPALIGEAVLGLAALGFLGLGTPLPTPEIGSIIAEGRQYVIQAWWISTLPGMVLCAILVTLAVSGQAFEEKEQHV